MEVKLQKIGNSSGIRLPKKIIEACGISDTMDLQVTGKTITITAKRKPREGWAEAAQKMHQLKEDMPLIPDDLDHDILDSWGK